MESALFSSVTDEAIFVGVFVLSVASTLVLIAIHRAEQRQLHEQVIAAVARSKALEGVLRDRALEADRRVAKAIAALAVTGSALGGLARMETPQANGTVRKIVRGIREVREKNNAALETLLDDWPPPRFGQENAAGAPPAQKSDTEESDPSH